MKKKIKIVGDKIIAKNHWATSIREIEQIAWDCGFADKWNKRDDDDLLVMNYLYDNRKDKDAKKTV